MNNQKHITIFVVQAYNAIDKQAGIISDLCTLDIIEETADMALIKAKQYIKKKMYRITSIIEKEK